MVRAPSPAVGSFGMRPQDLHAAYVLPTSAPTAQTVAIVDAYNDPNAETDLKTYSEAFSLPPCTPPAAASRRSTSTGATQQLPFPENASTDSKPRGGRRRRRSAKAEEATGWDLEISLDMETVHAVCQTCHIVLVEADRPSYADLETAERDRREPRRDEISNSCGGPEPAPRRRRRRPFNDPGTVITASAGDKATSGGTAQRRRTRYANSPPPPRTWSRSAAPA